VPGRFRVGKPLLTFRFLSSLILLLLSFSLVVGKSWGQTDEEIRQILIRESIAGYSGNCPCPYSTDRAGRRCGERSAYSRGGGSTLLCYESDVTQKMVDDYREAQKRKNRDPGKE